MDKDNKKKELVTHHMGVKYAGEDFIVTIQHVPKKDEDPPKQLIELAIGKLSNDMFSFMNISASAKFDQNKKGT